MYTNAINHLKSIYFKVYVCIFYEYKIILVRCTVWLFDLFITTIASRYHVWCSLDFYQTAIKKKAVQLKKLLFFLGIRFVRLWSNNIFYWPKMSLSLFLDFYFNYFDYIFYFFYNVFNFACVFYWAITGLMMIIQ